MIEKKVFGFKSSLERRNPIKPQDRLCFYTAKLGIIADSVAVSSPVNDPTVISPFYPFAFAIDNVSLYIQNPINLDSSLRKKLRCFQRERPRRSVVMVCPDISQDNKA